MTSFGNLSYNPVVTNEHDPLITLTQAKAYLIAEFGLSVSRPTLKRWAIRGVRGVKLDARVIGDWWYTRRSALRVFVESRNPPAAELELDAEPVDPAAIRAAVQARNELLRRGCLREKAPATVPGV